MIECTALANSVGGRTVEQIFGYPDNLKFRSSMTLFANVAKDHGSFLNALQEFYQGQQHQRTLDLMKRQPL